MAEDALRIRRVSFGDQHGSTAGAFELLAEVRVRKGQKSEAAALFAKALAIREKRLGKDHPDYARTLFASGERERAVEILQRRLPKAHNLMAQLWLGVNDPQRARAALAQAVSPDPIWQSKLRAR